jgi:rhomboid protease GluP
MKAVINMNGKFYELIINVLSQHYDFRIFEYKHLATEQSLWGVSRVLAGKRQFLVFGDIRETNAIKSSITRHMSEGQIEDSEVVYVLFTGGSMDLYNIEVVRSVIYEGGVFNRSLILVDSLGDNILYFDPEVSDVAQIIQALLASKSNMENKGRKQERAAITRMLIIINVLMFILTAYLSGSIFYANSNVLVYLGAKHNYLIDRGEYFRLITAMFLHGGLLHIALNMYALNAIGAMIERVYGKVKFILIYFTAGLTSSFLSYLFSPGISVGASGAIFGLMGAAAILGFKMRDRGGRNFASSIVQVIAINLLLGFTIPNIDNYGHLGGLLGGVLVTFIIDGIKKR